MTTAADGRALSTLRSALLGAVLLAPPLAAQTVSNPDFDSDVGGWTPLGAAFLDWSALDVSASGSSGSAVVTNVATGAGAGEGAGQCIDGVAGGETYWLSGWARVPSGQSETGYASLLYQAFSDEGCIGYLDSGWTNEISFADPDAWRWMGTGFTTQAGAESVRIRLGVLKAEAGGSFAAHFDRIRLIAAIFVDGFEIGDTSVWSSTQNADP